MRNVLKYLMLIAFLIMFFSVVAGYSLYYDEIFAFVMPGHTVGIADDGKEIAENTEFGPSFTGYYQVAVTAGNSTYDTGVQIEDLSGGRIRLSGEYSRVSFSFIGVPTGTITPEKGTWRFKPVVGKLFNGTVSVTIANRNSNYTINGAGSGTYNTLLAKGKGSGKAVGMRIAETAPALGETSLLGGLEQRVSIAASEKPYKEPSPLSAGGATAAAAAAAVLSSLAASRRRIVPEVVNEPSGDPFAALKRRLSEVEVKQPPVKSPVTKGRVTKGSVVISSGTKDAVGGDSRTTVEETRSLSIESEQGTVKGEGEVND